MVFNYTILLYTGNNLCSKYALGKKSRIASTAACMQPSNYYYYECTRVFYHTSNTTTQIIKL